VPKGKVQFSLRRTYKLSVLEFKFGFPSLHFIFIFCSLGGRQLTAIESEIEFVNI